MSFLGILEKIQSMSKSKSYIAINNLGQLKKLGKTYKQNFKLISNRIIFSKYIHTTLIHSIWIGDVRDMKNLVLQVIMAKITYQICFWTQFSQTFLKQKNHKVLIFHYKNLIVRIDTFQLHYRIIRNLNFLSILFLPFFNIFLKN